MTDAEWICWKLQYDRMGQAQQPLTSHVLNESLDMAVYWLESYSRQPNAGLGDCAHVCLSTIRKKLEG